MSIKTTRIPTSKSKGVTLIEILLVIGVLAIILTFAMPSAGNAVNKAELKAAVENVQYSLDMARKSARMKESAVSLHIPGLEEGKPQTITFSSPKKKGTNNGPQIQEFTLPTEIMLISDQDSFEFDEKGMVEKPGRILLLSKSDENVTSTILVE